ncbi:MAG: HAMP domain-containing sensor histidine kinase [Candidatus Aphodousia sp.]|nr:HAMP domain-containing histidine kinase [Sutterella sp.]MDY2899926.1 HAMP domain-containing sensor histidine kinase [Candidatus Aphodousia sp.]
MKKKFGLAQRVLLGLIIQTFIIVLAYALAISQSTEIMEKALIGEILHEEIVTSIKELDSHETLTLPETMHLYSNDERLQDIPTSLVNAKEGFTESVTDQQSTFIYRTELNGHSYIITRDQYQFELTEQLNQRIVILCSLLVLILSTLFGWWWLSTQVTQPILSLTHAVRTVRDTKIYEPIKIRTYNDEIGELTRICDETFERLHKALDREKLFTADISHELRSPLTIIQTSAELLEMRLEGKPEKKYVDKITASCVVMRDLMSVFLNLARGNALGHNDLDKTHDILESVCNFWRQEAKSKNLELHFESTGSCPGYQPPVLLSTVASNLVRNAIRYTEQGCVTLRETLEGFEVLDTGVGIAAEQKEKIFAPYTRASNKDGGIGMGLSIVKRICDRLGWRIELVDSEKGAHFKVYLAQSSLPTPLDTRPKI